MIIILKRPAAIMILIPVWNGHLQKVAALTFALVLVGGIIIALAGFVPIMIYLAIQIVIPAATGPVVLNAERVNIIVPRTAAIAVKMNALFPDR